MCTFSVLRCFEPSLQFLEFTLLLALSLQNNACVLTLLIVLVLPFSLISSKKMKENTSYEYLWHPPSPLPFASILHSLKKGVLVVDGSSPPTFSLFTLHTFQLAESIPIPLLPVVHSSCYSRCCQYSTAS